MLLKFMKSRKTGNKSSNRTLIMISTSISVRIVYQSNIYKTEEIYTICVVNSVCETLARYDPNTFTWGKLHLELI